MIMYCFDRQTDRQKGLAHWSFFLFSNILLIGANKLAKSARDEEGRRNEIDFKTKWRSIISVTLQHCNAKVISNKLISITRLER